MIGSSLDKYEVLQKVGEGGMATVYRGRHSTLNRDVAIKVLHPHLSSSPRNRKRFAREARAIEHLRHDNILEIFDYSGLEANDCYIITEFVDGDTLTAMLGRQGRLPSEVVAIVGIALSDALAYAHYEGILHRDLKTDNVMVRGDGVVKLMDFGIARFLDESQVTMTGALVGSPAFMSPEQAREEVLDLRSDLFALGTVLYYLVTGHLPFSGSNPSLILKNVIEGNRTNVAELAPTMSATLADVVERLMATSPDDRYNSADEAADALRHALSEVHIDPDAAQWGLRRFLSDADGYEADLDAHLGAVLVEEGRRLLGKGDHLAALRLFNRVLSLDEDNAEVLKLVQGLHYEPDDEPGQSRFMALGVAGFMLLAAALAALWIGSRGPVVDIIGAGTDSELEPAAAIVAPVTPSPSEPVAPQIVRIVPQPGPPTPPPAAPEIVAPSPAAATPKPVPEVEPPLPVEDPVAVVSFKLQKPGLAAEVFHRDQLLSDVRFPFELRPGIYDLEVRSDAFKTAKVHIELGPNEHHSETLSLEPLPATLRFPDAYGDACSVTMDGDSHGTLSTLERRLVVTDPLEAHEVIVTCDGNIARRQQYRGTMARDSVFPRP